MKEADDISCSKRGKRRHSKTDNTNAQQKPWLFKPGQSGNPAGCPNGGEKIERLALVRLWAIGNRCKQKSAGNSQWTLQAK
jgi:hypothetical protein